MIPYIDTQLDEWARWRMQARSSRSVSPYPAYRQMEHNYASAAIDPGPPRSWVPVNELHCIATDRALGALHAASPILYEATTEYYLRIGPSELVYRALGCSERTLYRRLHEAHLLLLGWLNDLAAGIAIPHAPIDTVTGNPTIPATLV